MASVPMRLDLSSANTDDEKFVLAVANQCARLFELSGWHIGFPFRPADVAALGDSVKAGFLLAAVELRDVLVLSDQGRKAIYDLGFQPVLERREGE